MKVNQIKALDAILRSKLNKNDKSLEQQYSDLNNKYIRLGIEGDAKTFLNDKLKTDGFLSEEGELTAKGYFFIENEGYEGEYNKLNTENTLKIWTKRMTITSSLSVIITMFLIGIQTYYLKGSTNEKETPTQEQTIETKRKEKKSSCKNLLQTKESEMAPEKKKSSEDSLQLHDS